MADTHDSRGARLRRLRRLRDASPHLEDPEFLEAYARKYRAELMAARDDILESYASDEMFLVVLTWMAPELLDVYRWRVRALGLAEQFDVRPPPEPVRPEPVRPVVPDPAPPSAPKPRRSKEEIEANIRRFRQRTLARVQVKVDDVRASIIQHTFHRI